MSNALSNMLRLNSQISFHYAVIGGDISAVYAVGLYRLCGVWRFEVREKFEAFVGLFPLIFAYLMLALEYNLSCFMFVSKEAASGWVERMNCLRRRERFLLYGICGFAVEVFFTAIWEAIENGNRKMHGLTSAYAFLIYGLSALVQESLYLLLKVGTIRNSSFQAFFRLWEYWSLTRKYCRWANSFVISICER